MTIKDIQILAEAHGLILTEEMKFNEMGIDFKVAFATDFYKNQWLLRIPRHEDLSEQIELEKRILELVKTHLSVDVPDWKIATPKLIAYPLLKDKPALTFDAVSYEVTWNIDKDSSSYISSFAKVLVQLHNISEEKVFEKGIKLLRPQDLRPEIADRIQIVKSELGISKKKEIRYRKWLDNDFLWPKFTRFIHGDLYAGHILTSSNDDVSGLIDWSTGQISDTSIDFSGHLTVFGDESLKTLIAEYEKQGGEVWDKLFEQTVERAAASPLAYGIFALETQDQVHITNAKELLSN